MAHAARRVVPALVGLALVAAGCGGDGSAAADGGWILGLLDRIPATAQDPVDVMVVDLASAAAAAGLAAPGPEASDDLVVNYFLGMPRDALVPELLRDPAPDFAALTREIGIEPALVTAAITAGTPAGLYQVLQGSFDRAAIDRAVRADSVWSDLLTTAEHAGVTYYSWGDDFQTDLARVTPVRPLGRGGRLALDGEYLHWAPWTAGMVGLIDAGSGAVPTLADDPLLARVARALEQAGVYSAILSVTSLNDLGAPASGRVLGIGGGRDDAGVFWVIAAIHDTAVAAEESAEAVRAVLTEGTIQSTGDPWSQRVSGFEVTVEGDLLLVVARATAGEGDWMRAYFTREALVLAAQG